jgi:hypothetical protein
MTLAQSGKNRQERVSHTAVISIVGILSHHYMVSQPKILLLKTVGILKFTAG